jgi:hypothetical protein
MPSGSSNRSKLFVFLQTDSIISGMVRYIPNNNLICALSVRGRVIDLIMIVFGDHHLQPRKSPLTSSATFKINIESLLYSHFYQKKPFHHASSLSNISNLFLMWLYHIQPHNWKVDAVFSAAYLLLLTMVNRWK